MTKRPFDRKRGMLIDEYEDPPGQKRGSYLPASMYGEELAPEDRRHLLDRTAAGKGTSFDLQDEKSPEYLDALLAGLGKQGWALPMALIRFLDDHRVQPALLDATEKARGRDLANFAQVVGMVGGPGSRELLRRRLAELAADAKTYEDDSFCNWLAGSLCTTACSLLQLDPDAMDAADALLRLFAHPCRHNRNSAFWHAAEVLESRRHVQTAPARRLSTALDAQLETADDELFLYLCDFFYPRHAKVVRQRLVSMLDQEAVETRGAAMRKLSQLPYGNGWALALIRDRLPTEKSLRLRVTITRMLGRLVPDDQRVMIVREALADESPSLRLEGLSLLEELPAPLARDPARDALKDEPDAMLKDRLQRCSERPAGADDELG